MWRTALAISISSFYVRQAETHSTAYQSAGPGLLSLSTGPAGIPSQLVTPIFSSHVSVDPSPELSWRYEIRVCGSSDPAHIGHRPADHDEHGRDGMVSCVSDQCLGTPHGPMLGIACRGFGITVLGCLRKQPFGCSAKLRSSSHTEPASPSAQSLSQLHPPHPGALWAQCRTEGTMWIHIPFLASLAYFE